MGSRIKILTDINLYITNVKAITNEIDGDQYGEELHYRITTAKIEEAYRNEHIVIELSV